MTIIKCTKIPYLNEEVIEKYKNVTVVGTEGMIIKMNLLILCAMSDSLKMALHEDDEDHTIITEFSLEELRQVKYFCMRGSCDAGAKSILQAFGLLKKSEILKYSKENEVIVTKDEQNQEQFSGAGDNIIDEIKNNKNENLILYQSNNSVEDEWNNISGFQFQIDQLESDILKENTSNASAKSKALTNKNLENSLMLSKAEKIFSILSFEK